MNGPQEASGSAEQQWQQPAQSDAGAPGGAATPGPALGASVQQAPIASYDPRYKSPLVASVLSIFPGVGQIYVGYYRLGFTHAIIVASTITLLASRMPDVFRPLLGIFLGFFFLYNIIDAGRRAALYNLALQKGASFELPETPSFSGGAGSLGGGIALIAIGIIFLMNTAYDYSLEWIEDWWPVAPILFGVYLVYRAVQEKAESRPERRAD